MHTQKNGTFLKTNKQKNRLSLFDQSVRKLTTKIISPSVVNEPPPPSINESHLLNKLYKLNKQINNLEHDVIAKDK